MEINARGSVVKTLCRERRWGTRVFGFVEVLRRAGNDRYRNVEEEEERRNSKSCEYPARARRHFSGAPTRFSLLHLRYLTGGFPRNRKKKGRKKTQQVR